MINYNVNENFWLWFDYNYFVNEVHDYDYDYSVNRLWLRDYDYSKSGYDYMKKSLLSQNALCAYIYFFNYSYVKNMHLSMRRKLAYIVAENIVFIYTRFCWNRTQGS